MGLVSIWHGEPIAHNWSSDLEKFFPFRVPQLGLRCRSAALPVVKNSAADNVLIIAVGSICRLHRCGALKDRLVHRGHHGQCAFGCFAKVT